MTDGASPRPHEGWADVYDLVLERTFGGELAAFTEETVRVVRELVDPPAGVMDFGAGTGRVALPLAAHGYRVTAVDPAPAMLARLAEKEGAKPSVRRLVSSVEDFRGAGDHHMALCVFSVLGYLLDAGTLEGAFLGMASSLRPGAVALVDVPGSEVLEGFEVESEEVLRHVVVEPVPGARNVHTYVEHTAVRGLHGVRTFHESFRIRLWARDQVLAAAGAAGLALEADLTHRFEGWGGDYLLFRRRG